MDKIENKFTYHKPTEKEKRVYVEIRAKGKDFAQCLLDNVVPGQERENALMKIEEAVMWANAAVAREPKYL